VDSVTHGVNRCGESVDIITFGVDRCGLCGHGEHFDDLVFAILFLKVYWYKSMKFIFVQRNNHFNQH